MPVETDSDFLVSKALVESLAGHRVVSYTVEDGTEPGENDTTIILSVSAILAPSPAQPNGRRHFILKCFPNNVYRQAYLKASNIFHKEFTFYTEWVPELTRMVGGSRSELLTPSFPPFVGGICLDFQTMREEEPDKVYQPLDNYIAMVNMKKAFGYRIVDRRRQMDWDHLHLAVRELAKIHALSWAYKQKVAREELENIFSFLRPPVMLPCFRDGWAGLVGTSVEFAIKSLQKGSGHILKKEKLIQSLEKFKDHIDKLMVFFVDQDVRIEKELWKMHRTPPTHKAGEPWRIVSHGDCSTSNMLFKYNENKPERVILFDFQLVREACPTADLIFLIYCSTTSEFRKKYLSQVFQLYFDTFSEVCAALEVEPLPNFSVEELRARFHRSKLVGLMLALFRWPIMLLEQVRVLKDVTKRNVPIQDVSADAIEKGGGGAVYLERVVDILNELYEEGVI